MSSQVKKGQSDARNPPELELLISENERKN